MWRKQHAIGVIAWGVFCEVEARLSRHANCNMDQQLHIYSADYLYAPAVVNCEVGSTQRQKYLVSGPDAAFLVLLADGVA